MSRNEVDIERGEAIYRHGTESIWRAVITQALQDMASQSSKNEARLARIAAENWLHSADFIDVCVMADMSPDYVLYKIEQARIRGFRWRRQAGQGWRVQQRLRSLSFAELYQEGLI